ncbi:histone-lysine N-methyltransferase EZA1-like [Trifolium medium]|nr:histone-lysine N-methyltransferase EZA1-like [Trifolium medium]
MLGFSYWKPLEKELYLKGVEMFGRNSCLIARNLLSGLKTCMEISSYMHDGGVSMPYRSIIAASSIMNDSGKIDTECTVSLQAFLFPSSFTLHSHVLS